jgi:hypothetical protein
MILQGPHFRGADAKIVVEAILDAADDLPFVLQTARLADEQTNPQAADKHLRTTHAS